MDSVFTREELILQLTKLQNNRASGVRAIQHGDERIEYMSNAELESAINAIKRELAATDAPPSRIVNIQGRKGY